MTYNRLYALAYEVTDMLIDFDLRWTNNTLVEKTREHCFNDWLDWKEERMADEFSKEMDALYRYYDFLESEGEVLVEKDEETGDIYGFSVEYCDPEAED